MIENYNKGIKISVGKDYKNMSPSDVKLLIQLKCLANQNNFIMFANKNNFMSVLGYTSKNQFNKAFNRLIDSGYVNYYKDENSIQYTKIKTDETFELLDADFALKMTKELTPHEVKLYCTMLKYVNYKNNKNYVYPSNDVIINDFYEGDLSDEDIKKINSSKKLNKLKDSLIDKGYIINLVSFRINSSFSKLGYFINLGDSTKHVVDYESFIRKITNSTKMTLSTRENLERQGYKKLDKFIFLDIFYDSNDYSNDNESEMSYYYPDEDYSDYEDRHNNVNYEDCETYNPEKNPKKRKKRNIQDIINEL